MSDPSQTKVKLTESANVRFGSRLCENVGEQRMRRIVFSLLFFRRWQPALFFSESTKSRQNFYAHVRRRSFHTAWVIADIDASSRVLTAKRSDAGVNPKIKQHDFLALAFPQSVLRQINEALAKSGYGTIETT